MIEKEYYELYVDEPEEYEVEFVEAKIKPETVGHTTPTEQAQTVTPAPGTTFSAVEVDAIPPEYVVPSGTLDITENAEDINVRDKSAVNVNVRPSLQTPDPITPTKQQQTITPGTGYDGLASAVVEPIPGEYVIPTGEIIINQNGINDVRGYASANIQVPQPIGVVLTDFDNDGYPTTAIVSGTTLPDRYMYRVGDSSLVNFKPSCTTKIDTIVLMDGIKAFGNQCFEYCMLIEEITIPASVERYGNYCFRNCPQLKKVNFNGDAKVGLQMFYSTALTELIVGGDVLLWLDGCPSTVTLYDFSNCSFVFALGDVSWLQHANGCVLRVPQSLLSDWQIATNWNALTDVVWEGV